MSEAAKPWLVCWSFVHYERKENGYGLVEIEILVREKKTRVRKVVR